MLEKSSFPHPVIATILAVLMGVMLNRRGTYLSQARSFDEGKVVYDAQRCNGTQHALTGSGPASSNTFKGVLQCEQACYQEANRDPYG